MNIIYKNKKDLIENVISKKHTVLDVGFWGQGTSINDKNWVHNILKSAAKDVYGLDLEYDENLIKPSNHYFKTSAEDFSLSRKFDVVFASDLVEHLTNPGLFLESASRHIENDGFLVITTPNTFNIFNICEKFMKNEPTVNSDHTCYFNHKTLKQLLGKVGWEVLSIDYVYSLELSHKESLKKKFLNSIHRVLSFFTPKFVETLVVIAKKRY